jgi:hypothetical protein
METASPDVYMCYDDRINTYRWIKHYDSVLLQSDEFFYAYHAQAYKDTNISEFINSPESSENAYRASFLMSRISRFFGDEFVWTRMVGAFWGAFAAAIICLVAQEFFSKETVSIVSLLSALAPQTAFYSVRFLKEAWVILAVSIIIFGITMIIRNKKLPLAILTLAAAAMILIWVRFECFLIFTAVIPIAVCFRHRSNPVVKSIVILTVILLITAIMAWQTDQLVNKAEGLLDRFTITERAQSGRLETMDKIYKSHGLLRLFNIPLSVLNPPPKNLHYIFAPENGLYDIVLQADIYQWWLGLPFLIIGTIIIINMRTELFAILLPYIITISTSALLIGGLTPSLCRYRDSLAPAAFIIIGAGIDSLITEKKLWKNTIISSVYAVFVLLAIYFYIRGN